MITPHHTTEEMTVLDPIMKPNVATLRFVVVSLTFLYKGKFSQKHLSFLPEQ